MDVPKGELGLHREDLYFEVRGVLKLSIKPNRGPLLAGREGDLVDKSLHQLLLYDLHFLGLFVDPDRLEEVLLPVHLLDEVELWLLGEGFGTSTVVLVAPASFDASVYQVDDSEQQH